MKGICSRTESELDIEHRVIRGGDSKVCGHRIMVLAMLKEVPNARYMQEEYSKSRASKVLEGSPQLNAWAEVLRVHLSKTSISFR